MVLLFELDANALHSSASLPFNSATSAIDSMASSNAAPA